MSVTERQKRPLTREYPPPEDCPPCTGVDLRTPLFPFLMARRWHATIGCTSRDSRLSSRDSANLEKMERRSEDSDSLVFTAARGGRLHAGNWHGDVWKPAREAAGFPALRFHHLRHSAVPLWVETGANLLQVSRWLGHSSVQMTADVYGTSSPRPTTPSWPASTTPSERSISQGPAERPEAHRRMWSRTRSRTPSGRSIVPARSSSVSTSTRRSLISAAANDRSFSRPATSLETTKSCASRQTAALGSASARLNGTTRSRQPLGRTAVVTETPCP